MRPFRLPLLLTCLRLSPAGLLLFGCAGVAGGARAQKTPPAASSAPSVVERWVALTAAPGGDGTRKKPFATLAQALASEGPARIHLGPGRYRGPFVSLAEVALLGPAEAGLGAAVLEAAEGQTLLTPRGALSLERLTLEGGARAVSTTFPLTATDVRFMGQQEAAIVLGKGGVLQLSDSTLLLEEPGAMGIQAESASVTLRGVVVRGALARGIQSRGESHVQVFDSQFEGPSNAVSQRGGSLHLERVRVRGGSGPAVFAGGGSVKLTALEVVGHEFALQTGGGAKLDVRGLQSTGATRAGLGLVKSEGTLDDVTISRSGSFGGVQIINSRLRFRRLHVQEASVVGLIAIGGADVVLGSTRIEGVLDPENDSGNGIEVRRSRLRFGELTMSGIAGVGLFASEASRVLGATLEVEAPRWSAVGVELDSNVTIKRVAVRNAAGNALIVPGRGRLEVLRLEVEGPKIDPISAACAEGAKLILRSLVGVKREAIDEPCVSFRPGG